jgi:hypothetical protein
MFGLVLYRRRTFLADFVVCKRANAPNSGSARFSPMNYLISSQKCIKFFGNLATHHNLFLALGVSESQEGYYGTVKHDFFTS